MTTLVIRGGHLIDPSAGVDALKDILLKDGRVADGPQSAILEQVKNGVAIRMAVVERALAARAKPASEA